MFEQLLFPGKPPKKLETRVTLVGDLLPGNSGAMAIGCNGGIYLGGGRLQDGSGGAISTFRRFDLTTRQWVNLANLPNGRSGGTLSYWNGKIYLFSGNTVNSSTYTKELHAYDIATDTWTSLTPTPNLGRTYHGAVVYQGEIYFFGGWNGTQATPQLRLADVYTISNNTWRVIAQLPESRHGHAIAISGTGVYIFGGLTNGGSKTNNDIIRYTIGDNVYNGFVAPATQPAIRCYSCLLPAYGKFYVFGGYTDGNATDSLADFWEYIPGLNSWRNLTLTGDTLTKRGGFASAVENGEFHFFNGLGKAGDASMVRTDHLYIE